MKGDILSFFLRYMSSVSAKYNLPINHARNMISLLPLCIPKSGHETIAFNDALDNLRKGTQMNNELLIFTEIN